MDNEKDIKDLTEIELREAYDLHLDYESEKQKERFMSILRSLDISELVTLYLSAKGVTVEQSQGIISQDIVKTLHSLQEGVNKITE